jgi:hypothetical protein
MALDDRSESLTSLVNQKTSGKVGRYEATIHTSNGRKAKIYRFGGIDVIPSVLSFKSKPVELASWR